MSEIERAIEKMTTSEPTTGEIVRALRDAPNYNGMAGTTTTVEDIAADRLESQEQTIAALTDRAEQAEARGKAAISIIKQNNVWHKKLLEKAKEITESLRGLPQEGEGK